ncbi:MAG TPA: hypothetical protein VHR41_01870 [Gemmatimonadales bacterium]|jgi:hypothetical protein|nr:hypothetical protein [Gemmatimonadales bacterium]
MHASSRQEASPLAYVFWHWRRQGVAGPSYVELQRRFHAALAAAPPPGFIDSRSVAIRGVSWAAAGEEAYEDWYLVEDMAALDPLNQAAVTGSRQLPHDAAAAAAQGGTAGLYRLRAGSEADVQRTAAWFAKPDGMSYAELYAALEPLIDRTDGALWLRQMVLGPAPEFCLHTPEPVALPAPLVAQVVARSPIWPP